MSPLRIAADVRVLSGPRLGIGRVAQSMITALLALGGGDRYLLFGQNAFRAPIARRLRGELRSLGGDGRREEFLSRLPTILDRAAGEGLTRALHRRAVERFAPDLVLWIASRALFWPDAREIVWVHDLIHRKIPDAVPAPLRARLDTDLPRLVRRAAAVVAVSEHTKKDLVSDLGIPPGRIVVIPPGVGGEFRPLPGAEEREAERLRLGLPEAYVLFVGSLFANKNVGLLLRAMRSLAARPGFRHSLVIVTPGGTESEALRRKSELPPLGGRVLFRPFASGSDLRSLYSLADLFLFPSLYEGFGIPPLEAMACGTPVVASSRTSVPEVVGDAGILLDPESETPWVETIARLLADPAERGRLAAAGRDRARRFTWEESARKARALFASLVPEGA